MSMRNSTARRGSGFALVPALFLIVVVGLLAVIAVRVTTAQQETVTLGLQQARALAAGAGIDWAAYNALKGSCAGGTLTLPGASLAGYTVVVTCVSTAFTDGGGSYQSYSIGATATFGNYGSADFSQRVVRATFTNDI